MKKNNKHCIFGNFITVFFAGVLSNTTLVANTLTFSSEEGYQTPGIAIAKISMPEIKIADGLLSTDVQTPVTKKAQEILNKLQHQQQETISLIAQLKTLFEATISEATQYHTLVSHIETRLQIGTTPGNPYLKRQENQSSLHLKHISNSILSMNDIETLITNKIQLTSMLYQATQEAFIIPGAIEEDHANLVSLSNELTHLIAMLKNLSALVSKNKQRQTQWLAHEKEKFIKLSQAVFAGRFSLTDYSVKAIPFPETVGFEKKTSSIPAAKPIPLHRVSRPIPQPRISENAHSSLPLITPVEEVHDKEKITPPKTKIPHISLSDVANGRNPIAIVSLKDATIQSFKWYVYSAAFRELRAHPQQVIDIVTISTRKQSHEVIENSKTLRDLMIEMGLDAKSLRLIHAIDNDAEAAQIQLYGQ